MPLYAWESKRQFAIEMLAPHNANIPASRIMPGYDEGGMLKTVKAKLRGAVQETEFVANISYNPKGQRERIKYGNGARTKYEYDEKTFRLKRLLSTRNNGADKLQDLNYLRPRGEHAADSNRLNSTSVRQTTVGYSYNEHGSMASMPHLNVMEWDFAERLSHITRGTTEAYYNYDGNGERVRKVVEKGNIIEERIYLGGFEIFRKRVNGNLELERETLHIMDDKRRIAVTETLTVNNGMVVSNPASLQRYQLSNNIESASLELDENASIISYEEYYPYGETSYRAGRNVVETGLKRYRYTGKEKDEESGLYYHGARYYVCWLGRWTAADPAGLADGVNLYAYCKGNPVSLVDPNGMQAEEKNKMPFKKTPIVEMATGDFDGGNSAVRDSGIANKKILKINMKKVESIQDKLQTPDHKRFTSKSIDSNIRQVITNKKNPIQEWTLPTKITPIEQANRKNNEAMYEIGELIYQNPIASLFYTFSTTRTKDPASQLNYVRIGESFNAFISGFGSANVNIPRDAKQTSARIITTEKTGLTQFDGKYYFNRDKEATPKECKINEISPSFSK